MQNTNLSGWEENYSADVENYNSRRERLLGEHRERRGEYIAQMNERL